MDPQSSVAARTLVAKFRRRRPLRAGSLLVTIFGDAIAPRGGAVSLASLIALAAPFGVRERLVRTSVGRLAMDGWLVSRRERGRSEYRLSPQGHARFVEATNRIYGNVDRQWTGDWTFALLPPAPASRRATLREPLTWLGFGQVEPGLLAHPTCSVDTVRFALRTMPLGDHVMVMRASTGSPATDRELAERCWDLGELAGRYRRFVRQFEPIVLGPPPDPVSAFVIRTLLIHEYRRILLRDPLLPVELLPDDWVGSAARVVCRDLYKKVFSRAEMHLESLAGRLDGPLQRLDDSALRRFGGLGYLAPAERA